MSLLYIVATPIGNLEDITMRALRVLREVDLIAAEDTRVTRKLLARYQVDTPVTSYHEHNKHRKLPALLDKLSSQKDIALVCDAGMPGINDPGSELVAAAAQAGFQVTAVPGPSAVTAAIAVSGIEVDGFVYLGFLPRARSERRAVLESLVSERRPLVAFETPHRLRAALTDLLDVLGDRKLSLCRELTKLHEEVYRGTVSGAIAHFERPRGEFTLVIEGGEGPQTDRRVQEEEARLLLSRLRDEGLGAKATVALVTEHSGLPRRQVYRMWLDTGVSSVGDEDEGGIRP